MIISERRRAGEWMNNNNRNNKLEINFMGRAARRVEAFANVFLMPKARYVYGFI